MDTPVQNSFWEQARRRPTDLALVSDEERYTFSEAARLATRFATVFAQAGLQVGDTISIVGRNEPLWVITYLAALQSGLYFTPLSPGQASADMAATWADCDAKLIVAGRGYPEWLDEAADAAEIPSLRRFKLTKGGSFRSLMAAAEDVDAEPPPWRAGMRALYTGGTTGAPKRIERPLPSATPEEAAEAITGTPLLLGLRAGESRHLVAGPLYHGGPLAYATAALHLGATLVLPPTWSAENAIRLMAEHRVNSTFMVPTMLARLLSIPKAGRDDADLSALEAVIHGAAPCPPALKFRVMEWLGPVLYEFYAATEGGGTYVNPHEWLGRPGTVGRALPGAIVRVVDDAGVDVPPGTVGRILMRSYNSETGELFWPGDLGYLDDEGWLFLTDRVADVIISGGVNVYSTQIEAGLASSDAIELCAVVGIPDPDWGEAVTAAVVPRSPGGDGVALEQALRTVAAARLAPPQRPKHYVFLEELPLTAAGKTDKRALRQQVRDLIETSRGK